jgi:mono/diheme cytochrome c family protein
MLLASGTVFFAVACQETPGQQAADPATVARERLARGQYLVSFAGCHDCHTPGYFFGRPDANRPLSGSDVGFHVPGMGTFYGPNLTSDPETGLGNWTEAQIVTAIRTGVRPDGRVLSPIMPWMSLAGLSDADAGAIAGYLKSLLPIKNDREVGPLGPDETPPAPYMAILAPGTRPPAPPPPPPEAAALTRVPAEITPPAPPPAAPAQ